MDDRQNIFLNIDDFDETKMIYIKPHLFNTVSKTVGIFYEHSDDETTKNKCHDRTKIIIKTPKMIVPFPIRKFEYTINNQKKNKTRKSDSETYRDNNKSSEESEDTPKKKYYNMTLSFTTLTNLYNEQQIKKFYKFIKKIDRVNEETMTDQRDRWRISKKSRYRKTLQRTSVDYPHYMDVNLPFDDETGYLFNVYDETSKKSTIDIIKPRSIVSVVLELTDLKFHKKYYCSNWTVLQIRKFKPYSHIQEFFMTSCFISDQDDPEDTVHANMIEKYNKTLQTKINFPRIPMLNNIVMNNLNPSCNLGGFPFFNPYAMNFAPNNSFNSYVPSQIDNGEQIRTTKKEMPETVTETCYKPPSLEELLSARKSLKKTTTIVKECKLGHVVDAEPDSAPVPDAPPLPQPDKTTARQKNVSKKKSKKSS